MMISEDKGNALTNFTAKQVLDTIDLIEKLHDNTPNGIVTDSDTILADLVGKADFEINDISFDLFDIFRKTTDKQSFLDMFYLFTDTSFEEYLVRCITETTKRN